MSKCKDIRPRYLNWFEKVFRKLIWLRHARKLTTPVEYCCIKSSYEFEGEPFKSKNIIIGWIPRPILESLTGEEFRHGYQLIMHKEHSDKLKKHPLFITNERWLDLEES